MWSFSLDHSAFMQTIADVLTTVLRGEPSSIPIFVEVHRKIFVGGPGGLVAEQGLELRLLIPGVRLGVLLQLHSWVMGAKAQFREFLAGEERVKQPTKEGAGHISRSQGIPVWRRGPQLASCCALEA